MEQSKIKHLKELHKKLGDLLTDPQPGLGSWNNALGNILLSISQYHRGADDNLIIGKSVKDVVSTMLANSGLYVCGDRNHPEAVVPLCVINGVVYSMQLDSPLHPDRFLDTFYIKEGPLT